MITHQQFLSNLITEYLLEKSDTPINTSLPPVPSQQVQVITIKDDPLPITPPRWVRTRKMAFKIPLTQKRPLPSVRGFTLFQDAFKKFVESEPELQKHEEFNPQGNWSKNTYGWAYRSFLKQYPKYNPKTAKDLPSPIQSNFIKKVIAPYSWYNILTHKQFSEAILRNSIHFQHPYYTPHNDPDLKWLHPMYKQMLHLKFEREIATITECLQPAMTRVKIHKECKTLLAKLSESVSVRPTQRTFHTRAPVKRMVARDKVSFPEVSIIKIKINNTKSLLKNKNQMSSNIGPSKTFQ